MISNNILLLYRLYNNGLIKKFNSIDLCVKSLIGIQSQYQNYALISIFNRVEYYDYSIFQNNNLIKSWGQRTTLHIYHKEDFNIISSIYMMSNNWVYKYANQLEIDYMKYIKCIEVYLNKNKHDILDKMKILQIIPKYKSEEIMNWSGLLILATYHKIIYGKLNKNNKKIYVKNDIKQNNVTIENVIKRYFKYYGPATKKDFLHWSGLKYSEIKKDLDSYLKISNYFLYKDDKYYYETIPKIEQCIFNNPIILGKFDPLLISYHNKEWILNGNNKSIIWKSGGQIEGVIIFLDKIKATWHYKIKDKNIIFIINEIISLTNEERIKLEQKFININNIFFKKKVKFDYKFIGGDK